MLPLTDQQPWHSRILNKIRNMYLCNVDKKGENGGSWFAMFPAVSLVLTVICSFYCEIQPSSKASLYSDLLL